MKECTICKEEKCLEDFVKRNNRKSGSQPYCKKCHNFKIRTTYSSIVMKNYDLKRMYGIDLNDYEEMLKEQNYCCKICKKNINTLNKGHKKALCVDHCHKTKKVRGLLCDSCNRGIGLLKEDLNILEEAIKYLSQ